MFLFLMLNLPSPDHDWSVRYQRFYLARIVRARSCFRTSLGRENDTQAALVLSSILQSAPVCSAGCGRVSITELDSKDFPRNPSSIVKTSSPEILSVPPHLRGRPRGLVVLREKRVGIRLLRSHGTWPTEIQEERR